MIETLMIFALGFLAATLGGLLLLPALNARAKRLADRRAEARLPLSPAEIAAERDFLRAQAAVRQRRLERRVEAVEARRHADMAAIGARTVEATVLARDLAARRSEIAAGEALRVRLEGELAEVRTDGTASLATLRALEEAHADLLDGLLAARRAGPDEPARSSSRDGSSTEAAAERDALRASLAAAEDALARTLAARDDGIAHDNADLRRRIGEVADLLLERGRPPRAETPQPVPAGALAAGA